jgi:hypothetical protein
MGFTVVAEKPDILTALGIASSRLKFTSLAGVLWPVIDPTRDDRPSHRRWSAGRGDD